MFFLTIVQNLSKICPDEYPLLKKLIMIEVWRETVELLTCTKNIKLEISSNNLCT